MNSFYGGRRVPGQSDFGQILFNASNVVDGTNNSTLKYNFNAGNPDFGGRELALAKLTLNYSWFNITAALGNNTFSYDYPSGAAGVYLTRNVTIPDGIYSYADLNTYLQFFMRNVSPVVSDASKTTRDYLLDDDGNEVFYLRISANVTRYRVQVDAFAVPTALPAGWSLPTTNPTPLPATSYTPRFTVNNAAFGTLVGFAGSAASPQKYPSSGNTTSDTSTLGTLVPELVQVSSVKVKVNIVARDAFTNDPGTLYQFSTENASPGDYITVEPNVLLWIACSNVSVPFVEVTLTDQDDQLMNIQEPQINLTLVHRTKSGPF